MKQLFLDIETTPLISYNWGRWEQNAIKVIQRSHLLTAAWRWEGQKTKSARIQKDDKALTLALWSLLDEADLVIAHNGDAFDLPKINTRFAFYGIKPPAPYKTVDTKKVAKSKFAFDSNSLNDLGEFLGLGKKIETGGFGLWERCMAGDAKAFALMEKYNRQDVDLLYKVYQRLLPYAKVPNLHEGVVCGRCGSDRLQSRGIARTNLSTYQRYQCQGCGGWMKGSERTKVPALLAI